MSSQTRILVSAHVLILVFSCFIIMNSVAAQTTNNPSIPDFSVKFVDKSYDVPPTTTTDPYTGKNTTVSSGYHVEIKLLEVTIKNQPFTTYLDSSGNYTSLYYILRYKGLFENEWEYYPSDSFKSNLPGKTPFESDVRSWPYIEASTSDYTIVLLPRELKDAQVGGQIEIQAQAWIGHDNKILWGEGRTAFTTYYFVGSSSNWSSTKTFTIPESASPATTLNPSATAIILTPTGTSASTENSQPLVTEGIIAAIILIVIAILLLLVRMKKHNLPTI